MCFTFHFRPIIAFEMIHAGPLNAAASRLEGIQKQWAGCGLNSNSLVSTTDPSRPVYEHLSVCVSPRHARLIATLIQ